MIKILDSALNILAILKEAESPFHSEEINGEKTLSFSAQLSEKVALNVNENSVIELDNDYFDIVYYQKQQAANGLLSMGVQAEHVSYRLNEPEYNMEYFASTGTPTVILTQLLEGTEFTVGTVEYIDNTTYSAQEAKSRRQLLMEFVDHLGGEVDFNKFEISIVVHRGSSAPKLLTKGKNIKVVSKVYDGRQKDELGNALISYTCEPIQLNNTQIALGDVVMLIQKDLGIQEQMRVVKYSYNPYNNLEASIELANFIDTLEFQMYRMEAKTVFKEKVYNGCRIGPEEGFVAERSDLKTKTIMNATEGISIYSDTGEGLERNFYVDLDGKIQAKGLQIDGSSEFKGAVDVTNGLANVKILPADGNPFGITYDGVPIFTVDAAGLMKAVGILITGNSKFEGTIETSEDAIVGKNLQLGDTLDSGKAIIFGSAVSISNPLNTEMLLISAFGNIKFETSFDVDFSNVNVIGLENSGYVKA